MKQGLDRVRARRKPPQALDGKNRRTSIEHRDAIGHKVGDVAAQYGRCTGAGLSHGQPGLAAARLSQDHDQSARRGCVSGSSVRSALVLGNTRDRTSNRNEPGCAFNVSAAVRSITNQTSKNGAAAAAHAGGRKTTIQASSGDEINQSRQALARIVPARE